MGHSAGGQFIGRYALGSNFIHNIKDIKINLFAANPSSYCYLNEYRIKNDEFHIPNDCKRYNDYGYGLEDLNSHMKSIDMKIRIPQYLNSNLTFLLGKEDNDSNHKFLDKSKSGMIQGVHRLERGQNFKKFLSKFYEGNSIQFLEVEKVDHNAKKMFKNDIVLSKIFKK